MSSDRIVKLKIHPYLKEYYIHRFGPEPIKAKLKTKLFRLIFNYLVRIPFNWRPPVSSEDTLLIELPYSDYIDVRSMCYIDPCSYGKISTLLYNLFYCDYVRYMDKCVYKGKKDIKTSIEEFIDVNQMSWDKTNYETLKKIYQRYRYPEKIKVKRKLAAHEKKNSHFCPSPVLYQSSEI